MMWDTRPRVSGSGGAGGGGATFSARRGNIFREKGGFGILLKAAS
jgi:hypothetical protein